MDKKLGTPIWLAILFSSIGILCFTVAIALNHKDFYRVCCYSGFIIFNAIVLYNEIKLLVKARSNDD
jgi:hypothetical protein